MRKFKKSSILLNRDQHGTGIVIETFHCMSCGIEAPTYDVFYHRIPGKRGLKTIKICAICDKYGIENVQPQFAMRSLVFPDFSGRLKANPLHPDHAQIERFLAANTAGNDIRR